MCMTFLGGNGKILLKDIKEKEGILIGRQMECCKDVRAHSPLQVEYRAPEAWTSPP